MLLAVAGCGLLLTACPFQSSLPHDRTAVETIVLDDGNPVATGEIEVTVNRQARRGAQAVGLGVRATSDGVAGGSPVGLMTVTPVSNVEPTDTEEPSLLRSTVPGWLETESVTSQIVLDGTASPVGSGSSISFDAACPSDEPCTSRFAYRVELIDYRPASVLEVPVELTAGVSYGPFAEEGPQVPDGASVEVLVSGPDYSSDQQVEPVGSWKVDLEQGGPDHEIVVTYPREATGGVVRFSQAADAQQGTTTRGAIHYPLDADDGEPTWSGVGVSELPLELGTCDAESCVLEARLVSPSVGAGIVTLFADARDSLDPLAPPIPGVEVTVTEATA